MKEQYSNFKEWLKKLALNKLLFHVQITSSRTFTSYYKGPETLPQLTANNIMETVGTAKWLPEEDTGPALPITPNTCSRKTRCGAPHTSTLAFHTPEYAIAASYKTKKILDPLIHTVGVSPAEDTQII